MIVVRAIAFLLFLALAVALVAWQVRNIRADFARIETGSAWILLVAAFVVPAAMAAVARFAPTRARRVIALLAGLPALPVTAGCAGFISIIQARGGNHGRTWDVALLMGAVLSLNVLLPMTLAHLLAGGGAGVVLGWMAVKAQFFVVVDYFLARALVHYFNSGASAFVSLRYLRRRVISLLSVVGIGVGVCVLILVNSVMTGFQTDFKQQVRGSLSHVLVRFDSSRFQPREDDDTAFAARWAEYVRRIQANAAIAPQWQAVIDETVARRQARDGESADRDKRLRESLQTGKDVTVRDMELLLDGGKPTDPREFYLSRVPNPKDAEREVRAAWHGPLLRSRLRTEFEDTARVLETHTNPSGVKDVVGTSWRVGTKALITPAADNREPPLAELVGVEPERENTISDLGRYVSAAEVNVFKNQYVLRPLVNILGATLGWETPQSLEAMGVAAPEFLYTEKGRAAPDGEIGAAMPEDLRRRLERRQFITASGGVRWPIFDTVQFAEYSPGQRIYERARKAHKAATRTDDLAELHQIVVQAEADLRVILLEYLNGPEPDNDPARAARWGCRVIFQQYLTGMGRVDAARRLAHSMAYRPLRDYLNDPQWADAPAAERELLEKLWSDINDAARLAHAGISPPEASESAREKALSDMHARLRALIAQATTRAEAANMPAMELLRQVAAMLPGDESLPLRGALEMGGALPLAFAAERAEDGAETARRRMEAYSKVLPLRTTLQPGEDVASYLARANEPGRRPSDGVSGQGQEPGIILGDALAQSPILSREGVGVGDVIEITIPLGYFRDGRQLIEAIQVKFRVTALFRSGLFEDNMGRVYCDFDELTSRLADSDARFYVGAKLADYSIYEGGLRADKLKDDIRRSLQTAGIRFGGVSLWEDEKRTLLEAVEREKMILGLIVSFIIVLAGVLILILVYQLVNEKVKDIGILKALGHSPWGVRSLFMFNALFIGLFGAVIGTVLGVTLSEHLNEIEDFIDRMTGVRLFPPDVYFLTYIPSVKGMLLIELALDIAAPVVLFSFGCGIIPAMIAARKDPVEALHYE